MRYKDFVVDVTVHPMKDNQLCVLIHSPSGMTYNLPKYKQYGVKPLKELKQHLGVFYQQYLRKISSKVG